jgi:hypothetical protein
MKKYIKKPEIVSAFQYVPGENSIYDANDGYKKLPDTSVCRICKKPYNQHGRLNGINGPAVIIGFTESVNGESVGTFNLCPGDYICENVAGQVFRMRKEVFEALYMPTPEYKDA